MPERIGLQALFDDKDFQRGIANYTKKVEEATRSTDQAAGQITKDTKEIGKSWESSAKDVGLASTIMVAAMTAALTKVTLTAARTEELGIVLNRVGQNIGKTAEDMKAYEDGVKAMGITTQAARQSLVQMVQAQIDLSHSTELARLAQDAAVIANLNSSEAFERLVTVIQRGSPLMARTLGIVVDFEGAYNRYAESVGKSADELTTAEKIEIRTQNVLENSAQIAGTYEAAMGTAGKQLRSMTRYTEELANELGESLLPVMSGAVQTGTDILKWLLDMDPVLRNTIVQAAALSTGILAIGKAATVTIPKMIAMVASLGPLGIAGALATAVAGLVIWGRQSEDAALAAAGSMAETAKSYEEYAMNLKAMEQGNWVLSESLYGIALAADAATKGVDALALTKAWDTIRGGFGLDMFGIEWIDELLNSLPKVTENMDALAYNTQRLAKDMTTAELAVLGDADMMRLLGRELGYSGEALDLFIKVMLRAADAEEILRLNIEASTLSMGDHEERMLGLAGAFIISANAAETWARALARTPKALPYQVKSKGKDFFGLNAEEIKEWEKTQQDVFKKAQSNAENYANALSQLYDQIVSTSQQAEQDRLQANEDYTRDALKLEQDLARQRANIMQDLDRELAGITRQLGQDRIDALTDLNRDLVDLDTDLAEDNEKTWKSYYATLESLAEAHGEKLKSITEKYAAQRASIEDKYRTTPTRDEEITSERERLQRELEALGRPRGYMERQQQAEILAALQALKDEELAIITAAQEEEIAAEETAYQEQQTQAAQRREEQLAANQEQIDKEAEQLQLGYERKLEDLRVAAEREREERNIAARQQLDDLRARGDEQRAELEAGHGARLAEIERGLAAETQGFRDAYKTQLSDLQTYLNQRTQQWRDHQREIENILGIASPSKWMQDIGKNMRLGLDAGFQGPSIATDLQQAVASFGQAANSLSLPTAAGGGASNVSNTNYTDNLNFRATFTQPETERSVRDMLRLNQNMLRMRRGG